MYIELPIPTVPWEWILALMGFTFGSAFANIDYQLQQTEWFKRKDEADQKIIKMFLDCFHHWWIGAILLYFPYDRAFTLFGYTFTLAGTFISEVLPWIGVGLFAHDWKDYKHVLERFKWYKEDETPEEP